jgi:protocatechuate 3,4-dioxygenase beta subunit
MKALDHVGLRRFVHKAASSGLAWLALSMCAFAGAGNLDFYVYDMKTGNEVRAYTARLRGTGGYDRTVNLGNTNYVRFSGVPTDQLYTLTVSKDGYYSRSIYRIIVSHNGTRTFNLGLTPTDVSIVFSISGRVVDAVTNQPLANAYVGGYRSVSGSTARRFYAITDSQGRFTIEHCIPGDYVISASRVGYYDSPTIVLSANAAINDALLPCAPHGTPLTTWRLDGFYDALSGAELRAGEFLLQSDAGWTIRHNFWSYAELENLPANQTYNITVRYVNRDGRLYYPSTLVGFRFTQGITNYTSHYLVPGDVQVGTLTGVVRNMLDGAPVPNARVRLFYGNRPLQSMYTDSQGRYTFNNVPRGYRGLIVEVSKPGWGTYSWRMPALNASSVTNDIFFCPNGTPTGTLYFYVYDEAAGYYINEPILQITLPSGHTMRVDLPDGNNDSISGLPAWQLYDLTMTASGYLSSTFLAQSVPYNSSRTLSYYMRRSTQTVGRILGTVRDLYTGNPIANARVSAYSQVYTDSQGRYTLGDQPIGTFNLSVGATGYISRTVQVTIGAGDTIVDFFLVPAEYPIGRVYGYVYESTTGSQITNSTVTAVAPNGLTLTYRTAPDSGYYNFPDLPFDLPLTFVASAPGYISAQVENFWPRQGDSHRIDFTLRPNWGGLRMGRTIKGQVQLNGYLGDATNVWLTVEAYQHDALVWRQDVRLNPDGSYEVNCPLNEPADLRLKADRWISTWLPAVNLQAIDQLPEVRFVHIGDTNDDDRIDDADLLTIMLRFGEKDPNAPDVNGDGYVDEADLMLVLFHFGAQGR